jgi:methionyl-tRNA formyltransferase
VHASLLPRWRGAAPIQRALLAGDAQTGVTIMQMDAGLDTGPMVDSARVSVGPRETGATLERKLAAQGARLLVAVLRRLEADGAIAATPQPALGVTYAAKIEKAEAAVDWRGQAVAIDRRIRAFDPVPGVRSALAGAPVKLWRAEPLAAASGLPPGTILAVDARGIVVACGEGTLRIEELQPAGGRRMSAAAFAAGHRLEPGARFGAPAD